jgi:hypothetical protein
MQIDRRFVGLLSALSLLPLAGCLSVVGPQTGRTLPAGETAGYAGLTVSKEKSTDEDEDDDTETTTTNNVTGMVVGARHGINGSIDVGARASSLGVGLIEGTFSLVATKSVAVSVGVGLGYVSVKSESKLKSTSDDDSVSVSGDSDSKSSYRVAEVPFHLSADVSPTLSVYGTPRYIYIHSESDDEDAEGGVDKNSSRAMSLSLGLLSRGPIGFFGEVAYYTSPDKHVELSGTQFAAGVTFDQR